MELTPHQAKYFALELSKHTASGDMHKLVPSRKEEGVDLNPHQVEIDSTHLIVNLFLIDFIASHYWWICSVDGDQKAFLNVILLRNRFVFTNQNENLTNANKTVCSVIENMLLNCFERNLTHELLKAIAELILVGFFRLDESFRDTDQLKSNTVLILKENGFTKFINV